MMDELQYMLHQKIGVFYKDISWKDNIYNEIKNYYEKLEYISLVWNSKDNTRIELKDGSVIYFVPTDSFSKGRRYSRAILQPGIDEEIIDCVIKRSITIPFYYVLEENKE